MTIEMIESSTSAMEGDRLRNICLKQVIERSIKCSRNLQFWSYFQEMGSLVLFRLANDQRLMLPNEGDRFCLVHLFLSGSLFLYSQLVDLLISRFYGIVCEQC